MNSEWPTTLPEVTESVRMQRAGDDIDDDRQQPESHAFEKADRQDDADGIQRQVQADEINRLGTVRVPRSWRRS